MNTIPDDFPDFDTPTDFSVLLDTSVTAEPIELLEVVQLGEGEIDPRIKLLSHSSRTMLHSCPRKFQLYRLQSAENPAIDSNRGITFAYGTAVGVGVQSTLQSRSESQVILDTFLAWDIDLLAANPKQHKSFWLAIYAVQKFVDLAARGYLKDYELVYLPSGKPAVELSFQIHLPDGFKYRGFVDAVLRHKVTGEILVLECKTSSGTANSATFKNSGQALGYSVVLDLLYPTLSSYRVLYVVYETKSYQYVELPFEKSLLQRALWLQELLVEKEKIDLYERYQTYPMHGESCFNFYSECEYLGLCTLKTEAQIRPLTKGILERIAKDESKYEYNIDFYDLVAAQIAKGDY
jgi:PD-(D/E)XK nuclease superfamily